MVFEILMRLIFMFFLLFSVAVNATDEEGSLVLAPNWQLHDEAGHLIKSSDFAGKPLVIHFWATWCPYCKKLQPGLNSLYLKYQDQGLQMIAISFNEDEGATPQAVLDARGMSFHTAIEGDNVARKLFAVTGTPTTVFINSKGEIVAKTMLSDPNDPRLEKIIQYMLTAD
jgi:cytochrome c biogenesis protein CcmG, thiol:disulfide interchange protein DsbE